MYIYTHWYPASSSDHYEGLYAHITNNPTIMACYPVLMVLSASTYFQRMPIAIFLPVLDGGILSS